MCFPFSSKKRRQVKEKKKITNKKKWQQKSPQPAAPPKRKNGPNEFIQLQVRGVLLLPSWGAKSHRKEEIQTVYAEATSHRKEEIQTVCACMLVCVGLPDTHHWGWGRGASQDDGQAKSRDHNTSRHKVSQLLAWVAAASVLWHPACYYTWYWCQHIEHHNKEWPPVAERGTVQY